MRLKLLLPSRILVDEEVSKVVAEAENGAFCLLPRHIDFVAALVPGLLSYTKQEDDEEGEEVFLATDEGTLVKVGDEVLVSTRRASVGPDLGALRRTVAEDYRELSEREREVRSAAARLHASLARRFLETQERVR